MTDLHIISLGAGVQSSAMLLMALHGEITPMPAAAIFADTGAEPESVYSQVAYLRDQIAGRFPLYTVSGGNIKDDILSALDSNLPTGHIGQPPFYVKDKLSNSEKKGMPPDTGGMLWRKCTAEYKLNPIRRKVRELWQEAGKPHVIQWIGISLDEQSRIKASGVKYITNRYPLVDMRLRRSDCLLWMRKRGHPEPPKSACYFCPYTSNSRWAQRQRDDPELFAEACAFDEKLRTGKLPGVTGDAYVHRSFIPLSEVKFGDEEQLDFQFGFDNECEGMCGV